MPSDFLETFSQFYAAAFESALASLSGQKVACLLVGQAESNRETFLPLLVEWSVMFELQYECSPPGRLGFLFKPKEAQRLSDLNAASPPDRDELDQREIAVLQTLISQATSMVSQQIRSQMDVACSAIHPGNTQSVGEPDSVYFAHALPTLTTLMVEVEALDFSAQILMLITPALANALNGRPSAKPQPTTPAPAKAPAASASALTAGANDRGGEKKDRPATATDIERNLERIMDIELPVTLNFGHTQMLLKDVLQFSPGSVIQLDRTVDEPVSLMVNNKVIARGEVVIVDGNYGIRITEIESTAERIRSLR